MPMIAVVAHTGKSFGGGLRELREVLAREGFADPLWYEVAKSRKAPIAPLQRSVGGRLRYRTGCCSWIRPAFAGFRGEPGGCAARVFFLPGVPGGEDPLVADDEQAGDGEHEGR